MKIIILLLTIGLSQAYAFSTYGQETKFNIKMKNSSLQSIFNRIEVDTDFHFFYKSEDLNLDRTFDVNMEDATIFQILDVVLEQTELSYKVFDKYIAVSKKDSGILSFEDALPQTNVITGKVVDSHGEPITGVTVQVKGTQTGIITDSDGNFSITIPKDAQSLIFSFVGMDTQEIRLNGDTNYQVTMNESVIGLDEIVAIGYGTAKKGELSTAVSTVAGIEKIQSRAVSSTESFLQGNVAGVTVVQNGGDPTSTPDVVIRGIGSINSESPLWVVDGMPYYGGPINPNDIESMTILKDAASASIYGAQASSGVIVVTTKSGKKGKPKVNIDLYTGIQQAMNLPTPLNAGQQSWAYNTATDNSGQARLPAHDATQNPWGTVTRTNWIDAIFRNASVNNANISISGGNDNRDRIADYSTYPPADPDVQNSCIRLLS